LLQAQAGRHRDLELERSRDVSEAQAASSAGQAAASTSLARGRVGALGIMFFVVAAAAPLTVVFGSLPAALAFGGIGIVGAMALAGVVLFLFAIGFTAMNSYVANAGAFYAYASRGLGKPAGIGVALVAVMSYAVLSIAFYGFIGFFANIAVNQNFNVDIPWWVFSAIALLAILALSARQVDVGAKVLGVLLIAEVTIVLAVMVAILIQGGPEGWSAEPVSLSNVILSPGTGILFVFAFGAYLGFEGTAVYAEEARDPDRSIPLATYASVAFLALFYSISFYVVIYGLGVTGAMDIAHNPDTAQYLTAIAAETFLGSTAVGVMLMLVVTSFFACLLAFHNATSRYIFSLARESLLPPSLATTNKAGSPFRASLVLLGIATAVVVVAVVAGIDPYFGVGIWTYSIGVAGLVFVQAMAAYSVVGFFRRDRRGHGVFRVLIAPLLGAIGLTVAWFVIAVNFEALTATAGIVNLWLILPVPILFLVGIVIGLAIKRRSPARYQAMLSEG
jgi:amino acid transporter